MSFPFHGKSDSVLLASCSKKGCPGKPPNVVQPIPIPFSSTIQAAFCLGLKPEAAQPLARANQSAPSSTWRRGNQEPSGCSAVTTLVPRVLGRKRGEPQLLLSGGGRGTSPGQTSTPARPGRAQASQSHEQPIPRGELLREARMQK